MITIIFAPPRTGKTAFMTYLANNYAFDYARNRAMQLELMNKQANGFTNIKTIPNCCVSANYDMTFFKYGYSKRVNRRINPFRLGFANLYVKTHFNLPFEVICITEAQKYLNSRMSLYFPEWQSRWYEQHGHNNLDILMDTQRPMLIDVNIRELANFIEIINLKIIRDKNNKIVRLKWRIREIANSFLFDKYLASGKRDSSCYVEKVITCNSNTLDCYNSQSCKPKFYAGHLQEDIDYLSAEPVGETCEDYISYLEEFDDELPENYFQSRRLSVKGGNK